MLLSDKSTYKWMGYNPTSGFRKKAVKLIGDLFVSHAIKSDLKRILDPPSEPTIPAFYGLPKVHKPEPVPLRPIVSCIHSVTYNLAKFAARILGPLVGRSLHHVRNTKDFVDKIKGLQLPDTETIISFDVTALFTSIPVEAALQAVKYKLLHDSTLEKRTNLSVKQLVDIVDLCLSTTYFSYGGVFY